MKIKLGRFQWTSRIEHRRMALLMLVALVALVAGALAIVQIVRLPEPDASVAAKNPGALTLAQLNASRRNRILNDEAMLLDPTPLFLPTQYNFSQTEVAKIAHRDAGEVFKLYPAQTTFAENTFEISFPDPVQPPARPVEALAYGNTLTPFVMLGRGDRKETPLRARMAVVEVVDAKSGRTLFALPLAQPSGGETRPGGAAIPPAVTAGDLWSPLEYLVAVGVDGAIGEPTLVRGSEPQAVTRFFEEYLMKNVHIDAHRQLASGFYLLRVGP